MYDDEDQYFDNPNDEQDEELDQDDDAELLEDDDESDDSDDDNQDQKRGGNLGKALQQERKRRKDLEAKNAEAEKRLQRLEAVLERSGQGRQQPQQYDPRVAEERNRRLQEALLENPTDVLGHFQQVAVNTAMKQMGQQLAPSIKRSVLQNPEYANVLEVEEVQVGVSEFIENQMAVQGYVNPDELDAAMKVFKRIYDSGAKNQGGQNREHPGKKRLTTTVGKNQSGRSSSDEEKMRELERASKNPRLYSELSQKPEYRKVLNAAMQKQLQR